MWQLFCLLLLFLFCRLVVLKSFNFFQEFYQIDIIRIGIEDVLFFFFIPFVFFVAAETVIGTTGGRAVYQNLSFRARCCGNAVRCRTFTCAGCFARCRGISAGNGIFAGFIRIVSAVPINNAFDFCMERCCGYHQGTKNGECNFFHGFSS